MKNFKLRIKKRSYNNFNTITIHAFAWGDGVKPRRISITIAGLREEV
jgi:hypothetical protein